MVAKADYETYWKLDMADSAISILIIPTMYLYFRALIHEGSFTWKDYIWFLPALVVGISTFFLYIAMDKAKAIDYASLGLNKSPGYAYIEALHKAHRFISVDLYDLTALIQIFGAGACAAISLKSYHHRLHKSYSTLESKSAHMNNIILLGFILTIFLALSIIFPKRSLWEQYPFWSSLYFLGWAIAYFCIFYYGSQKKYIVENLAQALHQADIEAEQNKYNLPNEEDTENDRPIDLKDNIGDNTEITQTNKYAKYLSSLRTQIDENKIFLQHNIRADEVSCLMRTNRTYLSRMIKEEYKCTFSEYINSRRVEYSQQLMRENPMMKQDELSEKCGFINASSFCRIFKQTTGMSPKEWCKK